MKKRILSLLLALTLCMGLAVSVSATGAYEYEELTLNYPRGLSVTFEQAAVGYGLIDQPTMEVDDVIACDTPSVFPVVILKDNSRVTVAGEGWGNDPVQYFLYQEVYAFDDDMVLFDPRVGGSRELHTGSVSQMFEDGKLCAATLEWWDGDTPMGGIILIRESQAAKFPLFSPGPKRVMEYSQWMQKTTMFQSTAELTGAAMADMNYNSFTITVTNNTDATDVGIVALVLASDIVTVSPVNYEVPAHSSVVCEVNTVGHMGQLGSRLTLVSGIENYVNAAVVNFESVEDYYAFCESFPVETNENNGLVVQNADGGSIMVCNGAPGDMWLSGLGISRKAIPAAYPGDNHNQCSPLSLS